ncbi:protein Lilipod [Coccinella septempunctata]|uniref:protein Lilipod n=1 Tax=Coccinella septempunctata TaxID=41139 RepID=UPI001D07AD66|nr:protein Lilipod [Coccinella septempunctata]
MNEMDDYEDDEPDIREQIFHNNVREQIIFLLLFLVLYLVSYAILKRYKRSNHEEYYSMDKDEITVYRISTALCTFSLAVSIGALLLLPISIISNEVLIIYANSYYIKWLNSSLIQGLWNYVFLFSNLSLFVFLPFAYLFTESEGFFGYRKGILGRVYETFTVLGLLGVLVLGMTYVISALIDKENSSLYRLLNLWSYYLPLLYSCISFFGALILLVSTPLGFIRLFDIMGKFYIKPQFIRDVNEEFYACAMEEESLRRRLKHAQVNGKFYTNVPPLSENLSSNSQDDEYALPQEVKKLRNGELQIALGTLLSELERRRKFLDKQRRSSSLLKNVIYPVAMLLLIGLTGIAVLYVIQNTVSLLIGIQALPVSSQQFTLGVSSLSKLGTLGAAVEILLILYFVATSFIGLYTTPIMRRIRPTPKSTPFILIIGNCALVLILSSALPVLLKILGITNFDLLGDFGRIEWLDDLYVVVGYNLMFAASSMLCVSMKFSAPVRRELYARIAESYRMLMNLSFLK